MSFEDLYNLVVKRAAPTTIQSFLDNNPHVDVNDAPTTSWTSLHKAAALGYDEVVEVLMRHPAIDINLQEWFMKDTPMTWRATMDMLYVSISCIQILAYLKISEERSTMQYSEKQ
jgi:hypothetical protein